MIKWYTSLWVYFVFVFFVYCFSMIIFDIENYTMFAKTASGKDNALYWAHFHVILTHVVWDCFLNWTFRMSISACWYHAYLSELKKNTQKLKNRKTWRNSKCSIAVNVVLWYFLNLYRSNFILWNSNGYICDFHWLAIEWTTSVLC